ncbi:MAG TPA: hypothetical protein VN200_00215 [Rhodoglobus sp.]|nr:hypothetical protein [Rhodoglobus sp.]
MNEARERGQALLDELAPEFEQLPGVSRGSMFHSLGLKRDGRFFAFIDGDGGVGMRLPEARVTELDEAGIAERMTIGTRSMREWASCPMSGVEHWRQLLQESYEFSPTPS